MFLEKFKNSLADDVTSVTNLRVTNLNVPGKQFKNSTVYVTSVTNLRVADLNVPWKQLKNSLADYVTSVTDLRVANFNVPE